MTRRCTSRPHPHTTRRAARTHRRTRPPFRPWPHSPVAPSLPFHSLCLCVGVRACVCVCACACAYVVRRCLACPGARAHTAPPSRTHLRTSRRTPPRAASPLAVHHTPTRPRPRPHAQVLLRRRLHHGGVRRQPEHHLPPHHALHNRVRLLRRRHRPRRDRPDLRHPLAEGARGMCARRCGTAGTIEPNRRRREASTQATCADRVADRVLTVLLTAR